MSLRGAVGQTEVGAAIALGLLTRVGVQGCKVGEWADMWVLADYVEIWADMWVLAIGYLLRLGEYGLIGG